jgi:hypothetical protein
MMMKKSRNLLLLLVPERERNEQSPNAHPHLLLLLLIPQLSHHADHPFPLLHLVHPSQIPLNLRLLHLLIRAYPRTNQLLPLDRHGHNVKSSQSKSMWQVPQV